MTDGHRAHYLSAEEDSARWDWLPPRTGDIVVSTRSKHGTTWVQTILLMLIHGTKLPDRLPMLSPWLDHLVEPIDEVVDRLDRQPHRRVIKTHTPLDGLPQNDTTTYFVVARHPLDAAVSLYHQAANIDWAQRAELTGEDPPLSAARPDLRTWLTGWISADASPTTNLDALPGVLHHLQDAWNRRGDPNVILVRYADLIADRQGQIQRLARALDLPDHDLGAISSATSFEQMRSVAETLAPDARGELKDRAAFFRRGRPGAGLEHLEPKHLARYHRTVRERVSPDLADWLHG